MGADNNTIHVPLQHVINHLCAQLQYTTLPLFPSSTQVEAADNSINQIPGVCRIAGDVRLSPFYNVVEMRKKVEGWVEEINKSLHTLEGNRGPSKYAVEGVEASVSLQFGEYMKGFHANKESAGCVCVSGIVRFSPLCLYLGLWLCLVGVACVFLPSFLYQQGVYWVWVWCALIFHVVCCVGSAPSFLD